MAKKTFFILLAILALGFSLRVKGLFTGLPSETGRLSTYHFDEYITFGALGAMDPARMDLYPGEALYWGTFQVYLQGAVLKAMQFAGVFTPGSKDYLKENLGMADRMYISGRLITIVFSCLSIVALFFVSSGILSGYFVFIPPLLLALSYVEVHMASIVKPDSIMLFFGICSFYFTLKALRGEGGRRAGILAAVFNGFSFVSKYTGLVFGFNYAAVVVYRALKEGAYLKWLVRGMLYIVVVLIVFILINPYFLIRTADSLVYMGAVFVKGAAADSIVQAYYHYLTQVLPAAFGWPAALLALVSTIYAFFPGTAREIRLAAAFSTFYLLRFGCTGQPTFTYSLPLAPFFALSAGYFVQKKLSGNRLLLALSVLVLLYTAAYSAYQKSIWSDSNTIAASSSWLESGVDPGSKVCVSKVDVWTPLVLRKYSPGLDLFAATDSSESLLKCMTALQDNLQRCDYAVISEYEAGFAAGRPELAGLGEKLSSDFRQAAVFRRPRSSLFLVGDSWHYLSASFMNPDIIVYKRKAGRGAP